MKKPFFLSDEEIEQILIMAHLMIRFGHHRNLEMTSKDIQEAMTWEDGEINPEVFVTLADLLKSINHQVAKHLEDDKHAG